MGIVIKTNLTAINAHRNLNNINKKTASSLERLASGFKINRAGDDASGLAISEQMKAQITALGTASNNCEDGISLIQTAEGYIEEIHNMLNRMVELAEKSANGILEESSVTAPWLAYGETGGVQNAGTDRAALQKEMDQICAEIDRLAMTANFNGNKLFYPSSKEVERDLLYNVGWATWETINNTTIYPYNDFSLQVGETSNKCDKLVLSLKFMTTDSLFFRRYNYGMQDVISADGSKILKDQTIMVSNSETYFIDEIEGQQIQYPFNGRNSAYKWGCSFNISYQAYAPKAAEVIRDVINEVSLQRAQLGAMQNRLEYTVNNLDTAEENIQSANSRIRDTDMAEEMMKYTQSNILTQAAQSMLSQANVQPQNVLQLLQ